MTDKEVSFGNEVFVKFAYQIKPCFLVEINHYIPAKNKMKRFFEWKILIHQVKPSDGKFFFDPVGNAPLIFTCPVKIFFCKRRQA